MDKATPRPFRTARELVRDWDASGAPKTSLYYRLLSAPLNEHPPGPSAQARAILAQVTSPTTESGGR